MLRRSFAGFEVVVENPRGSMRQWYDRDAQLTGQTEMLNDYGFLDGHIGTDGDEVDCYLGDHEDAPFVFVVHQLKAPEYERHDEDKCFIGFRDETEAREAFENHRNDGSRAYGGMSAIPVEKFRAKLERRTGTGKIRHEASLAAVNFEIVKRADGYHVLSENGKHLGGPYDSRSAAEGRLRQVEIHKHMDSSGRPQTIASSVRFDAGDAGGGQVRTGVWDRICVPGENIKDGERTEFNAETCGQMVANFGDRGDPVMIDWNHQSSYAHSNGQPAPALGFYGALAAIFGGQVTSCEYAGGVDQIAPPATLEDGLWGLRTDVTPKGHELLPGFKLLSPTFTPEGVNQLGEPIGYCLLAVAATNTPWQAGTRITFDREGRPVTFSLAEDVRAKYHNGDHQGALELLLKHADELGLNREQLYRMPTTEAVIVGMRSLKFGAQLFDGLHARIAKALGWSEADAKSASLASLRDLVRPVDPKLAEEISQAIQGGGYIRQEQTFATCSTGDHKVDQVGGKAAPHNWNGQQCPGSGKQVRTPQIGPGYDENGDPKGIPSAMERDPQMFGAYGDVKVGDTVEGNGPDGYFEGKVLEMFRASDGEYVKVQRVAGPRNFKKSDAKIRGYQAFAQTMAQDHLGREVKVGDTVKWLGDDSNRGTVVDIRGPNQITVKWSSRLDPMLVSSDEIALVRMSLLSILETLWWKVYTDRSPGGTFVQAGDEEQAKQKAERDGHGKATRAEPAKAMEAKMAVTMGIEEVVEPWMAQHFRAWLNGYIDPRDHREIEQKITALIKRDPELGNGSREWSDLKRMVGMEATMETTMARGSTADITKGDYVQDRAGKWIQVTQGGPDLACGVDSAGEYREIQLPDIADVVKAKPLDFAIEMASDLKPGDRVSYPGMKDEGTVTEVRPNEGANNNITFKGDKGTHYVNESHLLKMEAGGSVSMDLNSDFKAGDRVTHGGNEPATVVDPQPGSRNILIRPDHSGREIQVYKADLVKMERGGAVAMAIEWNRVQGGSVGNPRGGSVVKDSTGELWVIVEWDSPSAPAHLVSKTGINKTIPAGEFVSGYTVTSYERSTAASRGKGARIMSIANAARVVGLEPTANPKDVRRAFVQHFEDEAKKAAMEEGYDYSKHAGNLEEMAKAYEDAKFEEEEGGDPGEAPHVVMRKMATHFRKLGKMAAGDPPFGGKETPEEEAAEEAAGGHQLEEGDEEKKEAMTAMAKRLGLPARASLRQISMAMEARTTSLDKVGMLEGRIAEMEAQRATEVRNERVRSAFITFDNAVAQGRTKPEKRDVFIAAYQRNPKDAEGLLFAPGTFASKEILMHRMTAGGAPLGVDPRDGTSSTGLDQRAVTMSALGGARAVVFGENLSAATTAMADSDDPKVKARIDRELPEGVKGTKFESHERYMAADRIIRKERPDLVRAADPSL